MQREDVLFVRVSRRERDVVRAAAELEAMRTGEFARQALRLHAQRVLGAARVRTLLAEPVATRRSAS
jgi:uncharacterized protein (DUF1778 family)